MQSSNFASAFFHDDVGHRELFLYALISEKGAKEAFSNVDIALRMYLTTLVSKRSHEHAFTKLKFIKKSRRALLMHSTLIACDSYGHKRV